MAIMDPANIETHANLDITRERCPMTYVRVRLALDRILPTQVLCVTLKGEEPAVNVPNSAEQAGHTIVRLVTEPDGVIQLWIQKAAPRGG